MNRVTFWFKGAENNKSYVSVWADCIIEAEGKIKAYSGNNLVAMFEADMVLGVYGTEQKEQKARAEA